MWCGRSAQEIVAVWLVSMDLAEYLRGQHTMVLTRPSRMKQLTRSLCSFDGPRSGPSGLISSRTSAQSRSSALRISTSSTPPTHGKVRQERRYYVTQEGDVVEFRFNV